MEASENGHTLFDTILQFFQEDRWHYQAVEQKSVIKAGYHGERGTWICFVRSDEANQRVIFYADMGLNIPLEYRPAVSEYLMRVNYKLMVGNFEMNLDTGTARFRTSLEAPVDQVTVDMVRRLAYTCVHTMDHYFPGVVAVIHAGFSPEAALARVDNQAEIVAD